MLYPNYNAAEGGVISFTAICRFQCIKLGLDSIFKLSIHLPEVCELEDAGAACPRRVGSLTNEFHLSSGKQRLTFLLTDIVQEEGTSHGFATGIMEEV